MKDENRKELQEKLEIRERAVEDHRLGRRPFATEYFDRVGRKRWTLDEFGNVLADGVKIAGLIHSGAEVGDQCLSKREALALGEEMLKLLNR